ncbi:MAG TPA: ABC transporter ATP-binding protein [Fimbriimonadaceae bacterium]|nr:ABC transporter ATP-binding protein [Fimbriimonadaceae bacterium]
MLQMQGLVKLYKRHRAVDGLDLEVNRGEIVGLLGPNGAGKTTALRCIAGILRPNAGRILINGCDVVVDQARAKAGLAFVPEVPSLYELLTVDEHLRFVAMCFDTLPVYDALAAELLARYSLAEKRNDLVATLSKGQRQKLSVACALVHNANVFLFDEPMIGIDPSGVHEFKLELARLRDNGASILISTHLLDTAEKLCDRVIIVARGRKLAEGSLNELRSLEDMEGRSLEDIFLTLTEGDADRAPAALPS